MPLVCAARSARLKVSRGTVSNRLRKLEDAHVIVGYTVRLKPEAEPNQIRAWMGVVVDGVVVPKGSLAVSQTADQLKPPVQKTANPSPPGEPSNCW